MWKSIARLSSWGLMAAAAATSGGTLFPACALEESVTLDPPEFDTPKKAGGEQVAVFAGGCFWGVQAVFSHVKGVKKVLSGYSGGAMSSPTYERVSDGDTGHAESVEVRFDPSQVSYGELLHVFFSVAHNPTTKNRQGPDVGTQYRSAVFHTSADQKNVVEKYIAQLNKKNPWKAQIVTEVKPLERFWAAEDYHQDYLVLHPKQPYIVAHDLPKLVSLQKLFPLLWIGTPVKNR